MQNVTHGVRDGGLVLLEQVLELGHGEGLVDNQVPLQNRLSLKLQKFSIQMTQVNVFLLIHFVKNVNLQSKLVSKILLISKLQ